MALSVLARVSADLASLRETTASSLVQVHGRRQRPATGVAIGTDTFVVAAHTVAEREPLIVRLDGKQLEGSVVGSNAGQGVALIRAAGAGATAIAATPRPASDGELGVAVYRNPRGQLRSAIVTIHLSELIAKRLYGGALDVVLHTDFTPVPGWSGGLLFGADASPVGLLNGGLVRGAGLAIPLDAALGAAKDLEAHGSPKRGWLGIASQSVRIPERQRAGHDAERGLIVLDVTSGSPADRAGVLVGDVLVSFASKAVNQVEALLTLLSGDWVGREVPVEVIRGTERRVLQVNVVERPPR